MQDSVGGQRRETLNRLGYRDNQQGKKSDPCAF